MSAGTTVVIPVSVVVHAGGLCSWAETACRWSAGTTLRGLFRRHCPAIRTTPLCGGCPNGTCSASASRRGLFSLAALDNRTPCHRGARQAPGESTPDFVARAMREDHGFTVPGRSFLALDVVECQPKNASRLMAMRLAAIARLSHPFCGERVTVFLAPSWCTSAVANRLAVTTVLRSYRGWGRGIAGYSGSGVRCSASAGWRGGARGLCPTAG
jgi:hypothetical protein